MQCYRNLSGESGVVAYSYGDDWIEVEFVGRRPRLYRYTYSSTGRERVERMKALAEAGRGLATYISQEVKGGYVSRR